MQASPTLVLASPLPAQLGEFLLRSLNSPRAQRLHAAKFLVRVEAPHSSKVTVDFRPPNGHCDRVRRAAIDWPRYEVQRSTYVARTSQAIDCHLPRHGRGLDQDDRCFVGSNRPCRLIRIELRLVVLRPAWHLAQARAPSVRCGRGLLELDGICGRWQAALDQEAEPSPASVTTEPGGNGADAPEVRARTSGQVAVVVDGLGL